MRWFSAAANPPCRTNSQSAISEVRDLGFKIGLHTGGTYPSRLKELLPLLDWVGMDIKASLDDYAKVTATPGSGKKAWECAELLLESGIPHEFRTTVHPLYHTPDSIPATGGGIARTGRKTLRTPGIQAPGLRRRSGQHIRSPGTSGRCAMQPHRRNVQHLLGAARIKKAPHARGFFLQRADCIR